MERIDTTAPAEIRSGKDVADTLYHSELKTAKTVGDVRRRLDALVATVGSDGEAGERMTQIKASVDKASDGGTHDSVKLEDQVAGSNSVLGMNKLGTKDSLMRRDQLGAKQVTERTRYTMDTVLHEDSEEVGHAGQDPKAIPTLTVIDEHGQLKDATTVVEGNVVANVSARLGARREGLPQQTYVEGADLVEKLGRERVDSYVRKGGANVGNHLQTEVWRQNQGIEIGEMLRQGAAVGMTQEQVLRAAREIGKLPQASETPTVLAA